MNSEKSMTADVYVSERTRKIHDMLHAVLG